MAFLEDQTLPMSQNQNQPRDHHAKEDVASQKVERDRAGYPGPAHRAQPN